MGAPSSTYRVQFTPSFTFADAAGIADYLARLGVGALYGSPMLDAREGSTHGYDVTDPTRARPELGGDAERVALQARLKALDLGLVVDIVPNHMVVPNPWWEDVLAHGQASKYARYFDIDWSSGKVLLPVLGEDAPDEVHEHYLKANWRRGNTELNYRRFFDITELAAVRVEDPEVFEATHREVLSWGVTGLRIDHPDGLADPGGYFRRLREHFDGWLVVEKILGPDESLPQSWPVDGTTGYDALREICGVFIAPTDAYEGDFHSVEHSSRQQVADSILVAEVRRIARLVEGVEFEEACRAVAEVMVNFPVYRSYLPEGLGHWETAVRLSRSPAVRALDEQVRADPHGELATRIQQTSGMVVAKGTEDTAFYRYTNFVALNEVGGSPDRFGLPVSEFHQRAARRESAEPAAMTALSTHDTKRSEDVRARLAVLAEIPDAYLAFEAGMSQKHGLSEPTLNRLAWQSVVGAWPLTEERLGQYLEKASREAKIKTSWVDRNAEFDAEVAAWPAKALNEPEVAAFAERIKAPGWSNSLGQKLVQLTAPGVPDVYQGTELWDFSLVDPDNRRPVDYDVRRDLLARIESGWLPEVDDSGAAKLLVVQKALHVRKRGLHGYRPLHAEGPAAEHVLAFERSGVITVATRLPVGLEQKGWQDTVLPLPGAKWTDVLTGRPATEDLASLLDTYPVALLVQGDQ
ncbi:malto-oligosyltrehalose synthase [Lentzea flaviverrucosa]|uniref:(1->4)-alpha-D-glucan 1-alpha-D-glucosylmutase n=1 Tax=Lentzea flaviverrucosa TaxID=200379 RepID=A0A1H9KLP4_9PSEU|nr:malto-oligosyltrehalose synthase [Lentzea flaviverrucosa]RDI17914.1 maltooligosyl trehalose synthase [Lentzea flaviverrucosa]SEQ99989.1 (1->4)-alpha-D-glucan 1-alpha-D-glucosylmutase [Lentzea flaviverrucosa]